MRLRKTCFFIFSLVELLPPVEWSPGARVPLEDNIALRFHMKITPMNVKKTIDLHSRRLRSLNNGSRLLKEVSEGRRGSFIFATSLRRSNANGVAMMFSPLVLNKKLEPNAESKSIKRHVSERLAKVAYLSRMQIDVYLISYCPIVSKKCSDLYRPQEIETESTLSIEVMLEKLYWGC